MAAFSFVGLVNEALECSPDLRHLFVGNYAENSDSVIRLEEGGDEITELRVFADLPDTSDAPDHKEACVARVKLHAKESNSSRAVNVRQVQELYDFQPAEISASQGISISTESGDCVSQIAEAIRRLEGARIACGNATALRRTVIKSIYDTAESVSNGRIKPAPEWPPGEPRLIRGSKILAKYSFLGLLSDEVIFNAKDPDLALPPPWRKVSKSIWSVTTKFTDPNFEKVVRDLVVQLDAAFLPAIRDKRKKAFSDIMNMMTKHSITIEELAATVREKQGPGTYLVTQLATGHTARIPADSLDHARRQLLERHPTFNLKDYNFELIQDEE